MNTLLILAGGHSSRMKNSLTKSSLSEEVQQQALKLHKSLIPLGKRQIPLLTRLCEHAKEAGLERIIVVTSPENAAFYDWKSRLNSLLTKHLIIDFAKQHPPKSGPKPLGTADAVYQAMVKYPELQTQPLLIANGDNLYSSVALRRALEHPHPHHVLMAYESQSLGYQDSRIASFAIIKTDQDQFLLDIIEKPKVQALDEFRDTDGHLRVSMNLLRVEGSTFFKALTGCPIHPERGEKELPEAVRICAKSQEKSVFCDLLFESLPDLTSASDLEKFD